jgi:hypothetical protein
LGKGSLALTVFLSPEERRLPMALLYFSAARPANPIAGIFKSAGNVEILSWGGGLKVRASVSVPNQSIEVASN